jgi:hypothetical protein
MSNHKAELQSPPKTRTRGRANPGLACTKAVSRAEARWFYPEDRSGAGTANCI